MKLIEYNAKTGEITERELTAEEKFQMEVEIYEPSNDEMIIEVEDKLEELQAKIAELTETINILIDNEE